MGAEVVENSTRRMIFNHITTHPGVSFGMIRRVFGLAESTLRYHLHYLETSKEIKSSIQGNNRYYYPNQNFIFDDRSETKIKVHKLNSTQELLMDTIQRYPSITQKNLIIQTGIKRITVASNIKKLLNFGIIRKEPEGRNICYHYISDSEIKERIMKKLTVKLLNNEIEEKTFLALLHKLDST